MRRRGPMFDFRERRSPRRTADAFMDQEAAHAALARLVGVEWGRRADVLSKEGWATMPDRGKPDKAVARLCAMRLGEAYATLRQTVPIVQ